MAVRHKVSYKVGRKNKSLKSRLFIIHKLIKM